jgi:phosphoenolpyruvate synthase/pyruvate phosphate dikinase
LNVQIEAILDTVNHKTISSVEEASENIQALILSFPMPEEIENEIYTSFDIEKL